MAGGHCTREMENNPVRTAGAFFAHAGISEHGRNASPSELSRKPRRVSIRLGFLWNKSLNETAGHLQHKHGNHRRKVQTADGRNQLAKWRHNRLHQRVERLERLLIPSDVGEPTEQAPNDDQHAHKLENAGDEKSDVNHGATL
jgi:hypothetical protein